MPTKFWEHLKTAYDKHKIGIQATTGIITTGALVRFLPDILWTNSCLLKPYIMQILVSALLIMILLTILFYKRLQEIEEKLSKFNSPTTHITPEQKAALVKKENHNQLRFFKALFSAKSDN